MKKGTRNVYVFEVVAAPRSVPTSLAQAQETFLKYATELGSRFALPLRRRGRSPLIPTAQVADASLCVHAVPEAEGHREAAATSAAAQAFLAATVAALPLRLSPASCRPNTTANGGGPRYHVCHG
jgi:hypothetical protein